MKHLLAFVLFSFIQLYSGLMAQGDSFYGSYYRGLSAQYSITTPFHIVTGVDPNTGNISSTSATPINLDPELYYGGIGMNQLGWLYGIGPSQSDITGVDIISFKEDGTRNQLMTVTLPGGVRPYGPEFGMAIDATNIAWAVIVGEDEVSYLVKFTTNSGGTLSDYNYVGRFVTTTGATTPFIKDMVFDRSGNMYLIAGDSYLYYIDAVTLQGATGGTVPIEQKWLLKDNSGTPLAETGNQWKKLDGAAFTSTGKLLVSSATQVDRGDGQVDLYTYLNTYSVPSITDNTITVLDAINTLELEQLIAPYTYSQYNFLSYDFATAYELSPLTVQFGAIETYTKGNALYVNWQTLAEDHNDHFDIELSTDGETFRSIGTVKSKAAGGNSSTPVSYSFSKVLNAANLSIVPFVFLLAILLGVGALRSKKWKPVLVAGFIMVAAQFGCSRSNDTIDAGNPTKLFLRIAQVDIDGKKSYSKPVIVTNNN